MDWHIECVYVYLKYSQTDWYHQHEIDLGLQIWCKCELWSFWASELLALINFTSSHTQTQTNIYYKT